MGLEEGPWFTLGGDPEKLPREVGIQAESQVGKLQGGGQERLTLEKGSKDLKANSAQSIQKLKAFPKGLKDVCMIQFLVIIVLLLQKCTLLKLDYAY